MLIHDKVPPRFRSHFCFVSRFLLGGVVLLCRKSRFRPYLENDIGTTLWLGPLSRPGLGLAACRFIGSSRVPFFFNCRECARAGGVPGEGGEGCVADRRVEGLNHKDYTPELPTTKIYQYVA